jgi:tetratricopeptide (TPR) repeat protein
MKVVSRVFILASFALGASAATAQGIPLPKKYENASPDVRAAAGFPPIERVELPRVDINLLREVAGQDTPGCIKVKAGSPVTFRKRTLVEIPDIPEPELRLANALMDAGCFARAVDQLELLTRAQPDNLHAQYVIARMSWMRLGTPVAEQILAGALAEDSEFTSAKVLLAGIRFAQERLDESASLLEEAGLRSPNHLWVYLGKRRLEALRSPSQDLRVEMLEIIRDPSFSPSAREAAATIAKRMPQTDKQYEEVLRARLDFDSSLGMACKFHDLAVWLGEVEGQFPEVIKLLESPRAKEGRCIDLANNRILLAQAYLMEAAKISPNPGSANRHLIERADRLLNGDYTGVTTYALPRPQYATLKPFLDAAARRHQ